MQARLKHPIQFLESWKEGTRTIFGAVNRIMSYHNFAIVADDEELDFGPEMAYPDDMEECPDKGPLYSLEAMDKVVSKPAEHTLLCKVLPDALAGKFERIGSATVASSPHAVPIRLLP